MKPHRFIDCGSIMGTVVSKFYYWTMLRVDVNDLSVVLLSVKADYRGEKHEEAVHK